MKRLLEDGSDIKVVGEAESSEAAINLVEETKPDMILMYLKMQVIGGYDASRRLIRVNLILKIVVLTVFSEAPFPDRSVRAGTAGYITKNTNAEELIILPFLRKWLGHAGLELFALVTGLIIDYEILSKYCTECTAAVRDLSGDSPDFAIWYDGHKSECQINHTGYSSRMETEAAAILWQRSIKKCNMCYTFIFSDGDSKTFQHLMSLNIYGKKKAIKDNCNDVEKMKISIYVTLYHCSLSDAKPKYIKYPNGKLSWCFFKRALENGESPESHSVLKTKLTKEVVAKILPVYQRLASNEILSRCTSVKSQNAN
ncbi:response regulator GacA [Trichonephila clavipes]|nr:response regulator GacA [Trichonephila clavipes]